MQIKDVLVVGGDLRQVYLANKLARIKNDKFSYKVYAYGLEKSKDNLENIIIIDRLNEIKEKVDIIILPMPVQDVNENVNSPLSESIIKIEDIISNIKEDTVVLGGKISQNIQKELKSKNIKFYDYLNREELAVLNAIPTAEGTLQIIMEETAKTIFDSKILIIGAGRISKILRRYLISLGAHVTVSARKAEDFAWIETDRCKYIHNKDIKEELKNKDVIINTVPAKILNKDTLGNIDNETLIIDLASKPGGVDFQTAKKLGKKTIWALSLPGKVAPITAGHIILNTILNILEEMEENYE